MWTAFLHFLSTFENAVWDYFGFPAIIIVGVFLSLRSRWVQIRKFPHVCRTFVSFLLPKKTQGIPGIHPLKSFFAALGGCVGIGNVVSIVTAVQIGGPGALFWVWCTAIVGSLVKYAEIYLGIRYRVQIGNGYRGGPMYFLQHALGPAAAGLFCILLSIYGVEIFQFNIIAASLASLVNVDKIYIVLLLLILVFFAESGGIRRVANVSTIIVPLFILFYLAIGSWVLFQNRAHLIEVIITVFTSAFSSHAAVGGFVGSTLLMTISQGIRRGCYSSDIGVGYASIIYSESRIKEPALQASLVIFEVFLDSFVICTMSVLLVLLTNTWYSGADSIYLVQMALGLYIPHMNYFMPLFLFLLGYTTIVTYFFAGMKTAEFIFPKYGRYVYCTYAVIVFLLFSFVHMSYAQSVMMIVGAGLLGLNLLGIWRLRKELQFDF